MEHIPARVMAISQQIGDQPIAWKEHDDGSVVIVFNSKGKQTFTRDYVIEVPDKSFTPIIHTNKEAEEIVKTLPPKKKKKGDQ